MFDVLIVDDSADTRTLLHRAVLHSELPVRCVFEAGDGVEALAVLRRQKIGLVLSDINMPNMDGLELLAALQAEERWKSVPVVVISAEEDPQVSTQAARLGASGYLRKPFTIPEIHRCLNGVFRSRVAHSSKGVE